MAAPGPPPPPAWIASLTGIERSMHVVAQALSYVAPNPMLYFWGRGLQFAGRAGGELLGGSTGALIGSTIAGSATVGLVAAAIGIAIRDQIVQAQTSMFRAAAVSGQPGTFTPYSYGIQKAALGAQFNLSDQDVTSMQQGLASSGLFGIDQQFQQSMLYATEIMRLFGLSVQDSTELLKTEFINLGMSATQVQGQVKTAAFASQAGNISPQTVEQIMHDNPAIATAAAFGLTGDAASQAVNRATVATAAAVSIGKESGLSSVLASLIGPKDWAAMATQAGFLYTGPNPAGQYTTMVQNNPAAVMDQFINRTKSLYQTNLRAPGATQLSAGEATLAEVNAFLAPTGQQMNLGQLNQLLTTQDTAVGELQKINAGIQQIISKATAQGAGQQPGMYQQIDQYLVKDQTGKIISTTAPTPAGSFFHALAQGSALGFGQGASEMGTVFHNAFASGVGPQTATGLLSILSGAVLVPLLADTWKGLTGALSTPILDTTSSPSSSPSPPSPTASPTPSAGSTPGSGNASPPTGGGGGGAQGQPQTVRVEGQTNVTITVKSGNQVQTVQTPVPLTSAQYTNQRQSNNYSSPSNRQPVPGPTSTP